MSVDRAPWSAVQLLRRSPILFVHYAVVLLSAVALLLTGCGGGGGSTSSSSAGGGGGGNDQASLSLSTNSIQVSATTADAAPTAQVSVSVIATAAGTFYIAGKTSYNGIDSVDSAASGSADLITITFKAPATLAAGTYTDSLILSGCYDKDCNRQVSNSPQTIAVKYTVTVPPAQVYGLNPGTAVAGDPGFTLSVTGSNFNSQSVVQWNGSPRSTTFVSSSQLTAPITAADIASVGSATVSVSNQADGTVSNSVGFNIVGPSLSMVTPNSATAGAPARSLTIDGYNFTPSTVVQWNGFARPTTFVSATRLTAQISQSDLANAGTIPITVASGPGGSVVSSSLPFTIHPLPALALSSVSPTKVNARGPTFFLAVLGQGFTASSVVQWNGAPRTTTYVSTNEVLAQIPASDIASTGSATVLVQNPSMQGGNSSTSTVTIAAYSIDSVGFQITPSHSGAIKFNSVSFPAHDKWSVDVGGKPSYAVIADGKVIVTVSVGTGSQLLALDQATGSTVWGPVVIAGTANAAYDNGTVFVISSIFGNSAQLQAYDGATGNRKWSTLLPGQYAFSSAPTAADGYVFTGGAGSGGTLYAVRQDNGALAWTTEVENGDDSTPAVTADGVYVNYSCWTYVFRPATGESIWNNNTGCEGGGGATPVVANGVLYAPNGFATYNGAQFDAETGQLLGSYVADNPPAIADQTGYFLQSGTLRAVTLSSNTVAWSFAGDGMLATSPILVSQYVVIGSTSGKLYGLDAATGQQVWQVDSGAAISAGANWGAGIPLSGLSAGDGLLVVPAGTTVTAYTLSTNP